MVYYCNDLDKEAAEILARTFGVEAYKVCDSSILDQIKNEEGAIILVGGENANPLVKKLVDEGLIPAIAQFKDKCVYAWCKYGKATILVVAGWEKELTLWAAKLISLYKFLPDIETIEKTFGKNYIVFDKDFVPTLLTLRLFFLLTPPFTDVALKIIETLNPVLNKFGVGLLDHKVDYSFPYATVYLLVEAKPQTTAGPEILPVILTMKEFWIAIAVAVVSISAVLVSFAVKDIFIKGYEKEITLEEIKKEILTDPNVPEEVKKAYIEYEAKVKEKISFIEALKWVALGTLTLIGAAIVYKIWKK